ncbi:tripartite motif-containing protein 60-like [Hyperolius riggenbachi]|uniref:tripartite motif-containing protein 60-like n=1 Tax=Hyperolius riggenbachi TaxID=752182 RepID=UPI0035A29F71
MALFDWRNELNCSICLEMYTEPVTLTCGHSFCQECIQDTFVTQEECGFYTCPECREQFPNHPKLQRNMRLRNIVEHFRSTQQQPEDNGILCTYCIHTLVPAIKTCLQCEASLCEIHLGVHNTSLDHVLTEPIVFCQDRKCTLHKKILEYYCSIDGSCICVHCRLEGEHREHPVESLNEASEKKKEDLRHAIDQLSTKKERTEKNLQILEERQKKLHDKVFALSQQVISLFKEITEQVKALEDEVLSEICKQESLISLGISHLTQELEIQKDELSKRILQVEEFCAIVDPLTVLKRECPTYNSRNNQSLPQTGSLDEVPVSLVLHRGLLNIENILCNKAKQMFPQKLQSSDILLDPNTAHHKIHVSRDLKNVSSSQPPKKYPDGPKRFKSRQILSKSSFSRGKHYWEVDVSEAKCWIIGVAYHSIERKTDGDGSYIGYNKKSWGLSFRSGLYALYNRTPEKIEIDHPLESLGLYLDYEAGRLSFYQLQPMRHLYSFLTAFTEPLHAAFYVFENSSIRIKT